MMVPAHEIEKFEATTFPSLEDWRYQLKFLQSGFEGSTYLEKEYGHILGWQVRQAL